MKETTWLDLLIRAAEKRSKLLEFYQVLLLPRYEVPAVVFSGDVLQGAINAGYGHLPAGWAIKFYLDRN